MRSQRERFIANEKFFNQSPDLILNYVIYGASAQRVELIGVFLF